MKMKFTIGIEEMAANIRSAKKVAAQTNCALTIWASKFYGKADTFVGFNGVDKDIDGRVKVATWAGHESIDSYSVALAIVQPTGQVELLHNTPFEGPVPIILSVEI